MPFSPPPSTHALSPESTFVQVRERRLWAAEVAPLPFGPRLVRFPSLRFEHAQPQCGFEARARAAQGTLEGFHLPRGHPSKRPAAIARHVAFSVIRRRSQ